MANKIAMKKEIDQCPTLTAGQGMGGRKGITAVGTEYPGGSGGHRGGEYGPPTAETFDPGEEARNFVKLWITASSAEDLKEFRSRLPENPSKIVCFGNAVSGNLPGGLRKRQEELLKSMTRAGYRHFAKQIILDIHTACLITEGAYPADYIPVDAFGINLVKGRYGPFVHDRESKITTLRDIENSLVMIHKGMLKEEGKPGYCLRPSGYPEGLAEITAKGYSNMPQEKFPPEIEV